MLIGRIEELPGTVVHVIGKSQGYLGLPVRYQVMIDPADGSEVMTMTTAWFPTPKEIEALQAGQAIYLNLFGGQHPPVMMSVGPASEHEDTTKEAARIALLELALLEWQQLRERVGEGIAGRTMDAALKDAINRYFGDKENVG